MIHLLKRLAKKIYYLLGLKRNTSENFNRAGAPVQLHEFVLIGGSFFDNPEKIIESLRITPDNKLLEKGDFYPLFYNSNPRALELLKMLIKSCGPRQ
jgi:hypothetical protein